MGFMSNLLGNAGALDPNKLYSDYGRLLAEGEQIEIGFAVFRDTFIFTTRRLILIDVQGITGKKVEYLSIPYSKITRFSLETAGTFDLDAELKLWIGSDQTPLQKKFNKSVNIYDVQRVIASHIDGGSDSTSVLSTTPVAVPSGFIGSATHAHPTPLPIATSSPAAPPMPPTVPPPPNHP